MGIVPQHFSSSFTRGNPKMKFLLPVVFLLGCVFGEEAPYPPSGAKPQGALLVLPTERGLATASQPAPQYSAPQYLAPQSKPEGIENLKQTNENIFEKLRQEQGGNIGSYYVYLADGRLQRVQYTTAPLQQPAAQATDQQVNLQNSQTFQNSNTLQFNQQNAQANGRLQAYVNPETQQSQRFGKFVQPYPANQFQPTFPTQYPQGAGSEVNQQQTSSQYKENKSSGQYKQQETTGQYNRQPTANLYEHRPFNNQYNEEAASNQYSQQVPSGPAKQQQQKQDEIDREPQKQYSQNIAQQPGSFSSPYSQVSVQGAGSNENFAFTQDQIYQHQSQVQAQEQRYVQTPVTTGYLAAVQYTEVHPIASPIYTYSPTPLIRILRYAPKYQ